MSIGRKVALLGFCVMCALEAGCIPYAYPNLMSVPAVRLDARGPEPIHAFRVEVSGVRYQTEGAAPRTEDYTLSRIDAADGNRLPAQSDVSIEHGSLGA